MAEGPADLMDLEEVDLTKVARLTKELREMARNTGPREGRALVDCYYSLQEMRKSASNQRNAGQRDDEPAMPILDWVVAQDATMERRLKDLLGNFAEGYPVGRWAMSQVGIGPVIAAGLLAYIDITKALTPGHIYRFAGLDPSQNWIGKEEAERRIKGAAVDGKGRLTATALAALAEGAGIRLEVLMRRLVDKDGNPQPPTKDNVARALSLRPWNARLKVLCWKIGQSFVKVSGNEDAFYGRLWAERKAEEVRRNEAGEFAEQAARVLESRQYKRDTSAKAAYTAGKLPAAHLEARAERWAVKLFLSHWWQVAYESTYNKPAPTPYALEHLGHVHAIPVPGWPMENAADKDV